MRVQYCSTERLAIVSAFSHGNAMRNIILSFTIFFLLGSRGSAQTTEHQRTGVQGHENWRFMAGISVDLIDVGGMEGGEEGSLEIDPSVSFEVLYKQRLALSVELPIIARLALGNHDSSSSPVSAVALGDPSIAISFAFRASDWRLGAELSYTHPSGIWNDYEARERRIASGSGYRKLGAAISALRYMDPLVAGLVLSVERSFDRKEYHGSGSRPCVLAASLFATEALNAVVAISGGFSQRLAWPRQLNGLAVDDGLSFSLSGKLSILFSEGGGTTSFALSRLLSEFSSPIVLTIGYSLMLNGKGG